MDGGRDNSGRGGGSSRGRGGDGRGYHQNQGGRGRGRGGEGRGYDQGGRGRGGDGRGSYPNQGGRGNNQSQPNQGGGRGWGAPPAGGSSQQPSPQQPWGNRPPVQVNQPPPQQAWGNRPQAPQQSGPSTAAPTAAKPGTWSGRPWGPSTPPTQVQPQPRPPPQASHQPSAPKPRSPPQASHQPSADDLDIRNLKVSEEKSQNDQIEVIRRPDKGGTIAVRSVKLLVNHFPVRFNSNSTILHYDVDVKPCNDNGLQKKKLRKSELSMIKDKLFAEDDRLKAYALFKTVYDSEKNIFSAVQLPTGTFNVEIQEGEDVKRGSYTFTIKLVNELKLSKLNDYLRGNCSSIPRDILQGMDLVMKDNPSRRRIGVGRSFYSNEYYNNDDLGFGIAAYRGFQQSLKPTSRGLTLCLDYSVIAFRKPWPVLEFLKENVRGLNGFNDVKKFGREVYNALKGLKVTVTHRRTKQKYIIRGLSDEDACDVYFDQIDPEGVNPPIRTSLVDYFREKWGKNIQYPKIPCLELGRSASKSNKVPMEFCVLVEGQRFPKEDLDRNAGKFLKDLSVAKPWDRKDMINEMVRADDGPCGPVSRNFEMEVDPNMMRVTGRVIGSPQLKLGSNSSVKMNADNCQWNLLGKSFVDAKSIDRWALIDFTYGDRFYLNVEAFINKLMDRCRNLKVKIEEPLFYVNPGMKEFASTNRLENLLKHVVDESSKQNKEKLQLIVCVMTKRDPGYKALKWISETKIGVITQCCLSGPANKGDDQYLSNLCLKINAKLGGNNFELNSPLPHFGRGDHVMFIGADVNHPGARNTECPSIAAVVGTVNWPAANRYSARVSPQTHRCETIINFGSMCKDLINTYVRQNRVKPTRIVLFRDGVSNGQFEMVLSQEVIDFKKNVCVDGYNPTITVIVAQKRHQTRLFVENKNDGGRSGNVPPGTVVDREIVHPHNFDFYLCSHYGGLGTSKPTHYYVLWDENRFSSDELQKLINDMCYTYVRCTKPVSLVPPVYYADLVAYRGRMFQEVLLDTQQYASSSSSAGADSSFNQSFYNLHPNLKDVMFFV